MKEDSRVILALPCKPQQILASVSEGVQRLQQHLKSHPLGLPLPHEPLHATKSAFEKQPVSQRTRDATSKKSQVLVKDEGVMVAVQARNHIHRAAILLGAAVVGKVGRLGNKLKEQHAKMKEEGEMRKRAKRAERGMEHNPLKLAFPWQRKRRRGPHNENGIFRIGGARATAEALIRKGKSHEREMDVRAAIQCYEDANKLVPNTVDTLCLAAKAWSDACYLDEIHRERLSDQDKRDVNLKAMEYAKQAISMSPTRALPHVACCISMGRMAVFSDNKTKVRLAKEAREQAVIALEKEPGDDLAHHLMGRWHWEMANINGIVRALIRLMYGTDLATGTHADALRHYRKAAELNPARLVHRVEIGRSLARMGERERALEELEHAVTLDVEDINAHLQKVDAELLVKDLRRSIKRRPASGAAAQTAAAQGSQQQGPGAQLPWNWKLPHIQNLFAAQPPDAPSSQAGSPTPAKPADTPLPLSFTNSPTDAPGAHTAGTGVQAVALKQDVGVGAKPPQKQSAAGQFQWPVWGNGPPKGSQGGVPDSTGKAVKRDQQQQPGSFLGLQLPNLKNPFEGWGRRVAPGSE